MEGDHIKLYPYLQPFAWLYGMGVGIRNLMFDCGLLHSMSFPKPVISIGNLTVGGTGKTPHTEYLIRLLQNHYRVAVLSRGYKRKSKGFVRANSKTTMPEIGDEPFQMMKKFPNVQIAVDSDRCNGIINLISKQQKPPVDVILLDDAYQHRYVKPDLNILLMDYHRLVYFDRLLPAGRLREPVSEKKRADIVIVTKCPLYLTPMDKRGIEHSLNLLPHQKLFFTTFSYPKDFASKYKAEDLLLVTGIASPQQILYDLERCCGLKNIDFISYPDHHDFTQDDIKEIRQRANGRKILTTEKDAARLSAVQHDLPLITIPIQVEFLDETQKDEFCNIIFSNIYRKK